jgi:hypothetical protein
VLMNVVFLTIKIINSVGTVLTIAKLADQRLTASNADCLL